MILERSSPPEYDHTFKSILTSNGEHLQCLSPQVIARVQQRPAACNYHHHQKSFLMVFRTPWRRDAEAYHASSLTQSEGNPNSPRTRCKNGKADASAAVKMFPHTNGPPTAVPSSPAPSARHASRSFKTAVRLASSEVEPPENTARFPEGFKRSLTMPRQLEEIARRSSGFSGPCIR